DHRLSRNTKATGRAACEPRLPPLLSALCTEPCRRAVVLRGDGGPPMRSLPILALSLVGLALTPACWADNDKGHGHGRGHGKDKEIALAPARIIVSDRDR